jgi:1-phosphofructokinase family hexose kinase
MHTLIVALNPSIDVEWRVRSVRWEEKNSVESERRWAGGKGINVARWLKFLGGQPRLLLPLGARNGKELAAFLRDEAISSVIVPVSGSTRANIIVSTAAQGQMRFNPAGPTLSRAEWREIIRRLQHELPRSELVVLSGSLPQGLPDDAYARLTQCAQEFGVKVLLDCDGPALSAAVKAKPFLVKPNEHELARWRKRTLKSAEAVWQAALALSQATEGWVLVSRGASGGILVNQRHGYGWACGAPRSKPLNTVGAGDAMLAAVARGIALSLPPADLLQFGVTVGSTATHYPAGRLPTKRISVNQNRAY